MPIIFGILFLIPMAAAALVEYLCCRLPKRRFWRMLPPLADLIFLLVAGLVRYQNWQSDAVSPLTQMLIVPGLPGMAVGLGCFLGWRLWKRLWSPRIIDRDKLGKDH